MPTAKSSAQVREWPPRRSPMSTAGTFLAGSCWCTRSLKCGAACNLPACPPAHVDRATCPHLPPAALAAAKLWCDVESSEEAEELSKLFDFTLVPAFTGGVRGVVGCCQAWLPAQRRRIVSKALVSWPGAPT